MGKHVIAATDYANYVAHYLTGTDDTNVNLFHYHPNINDAFHIALENYINPTSGPLCLALCLKMCMRK